MVEAPSGTTNQNIAGLAGGNEQNASRAQRDYLVA